MKRIKFLCQCCGEDFMITEEIEEGEEVICPECSEDCSGDCREIEVVEE